MDFKQLESFVAVVDEGSFSNAAQRLQLSQSMVTIHIRNLETELGTRLLNRTTRSMELSADGKTYYQYARQMLKLNRDSQFALSRARQDENTINILATPYTSRYYLAECMSRFHLDHPQAGFNITVCYNTEIGSKLQAGGFEFAFCNMKIMDTDYNVCHYDTTPMVIITPNRAPFTEIKSFSTELLGETPLITRSSSSALQQEFLRWVHTYAPNMKLNVAAAVDDTETIKNLVAAGTGVSFMSEVAVREYVRTGKLLMFPVESTIPHNLYYIYKKKYLTELQEQFRDFILNSVENNSEE